MPPGGAANRPLLQKRGFPVLKFLISLQNLLAQPLRGDDRGATAVEYGLMVALIAAAIVVTVTALGGQLNTLFTSVTGSL
jgi:pilus assembly protein Flp/PilA